MDDQELIEAISRGDRGAFDALADRYYDALCAFAVNIVGGVAAAEDVVQESLVDLWVKRGVLARVVWARNYLYATVRNHAVSWLRSEHVRPHGGVDYDEPTDDEMSRWMIEQETSRLLLEAIDRLPPRAAAVIRLTLEGVRQDEIGERMGITVATVKALKADGMHKLKKMLAGLCVLLGIV